MMENSQRLWSWGPWEDVAKAQSIWQLVQVFQGISLNINLSENIIKWDIEETKKGGPFEEILQCDIFVNCIYLSNPIPPFITKESIVKDGRKLSVLVDVSCDYTSPYNPLPIYTEGTTFDKPTIKVVNE